MVHGAAAVAQVQPGGQRPGKIVLRPLYGFGQCQRLALARALLHDSPVYIFDEATSNIDVESENDIMALIRTLARTKTVILISHRLVNVAETDTLYVMEAGRVVEQGVHRDLLARGGQYARLWNAQQELEHYTKQEVPA